MNFLATVLAETEELAPLLMPPLAFAGIAVAVFTLLGFVTWSYRDVANRHANKASKGQDSHGAGH
ncbi:hypothetical protein HDC94_002184 [Leifsonia sp. AK011]|jgi:hypothetical protein|uniref:hypothetical protein n=1 Tax=Leifsonia sp. AK011 TaxID=2723075 RepID=UPI0015CC5A8A|nr:hypothetical protein [Leifsonia sp. AK011]NYF11028.1 hypothetical protein [Leifsonia sp. AK011]